MVTLHHDAIQTLAEDSLDQKNNVAKGVLDAQHGDGKENITSKPRDNKNTSKYKLSKKVHKNTDIIKNKGCHKSHHKHNQNKKSTSEIIADMIKSGHENDNSKNNKEHNTKRQNISNREIVYDDNSVDCNTEMQMKSCKNSSRGCPKKRLKSDGRLWYHEVICTYPPTMYTRQRDRVTVQAEGTLDKHLSGSLNKFISFNNSFLKTVIVTQFFFCNRDNEELVFQPSTLLQHNFLDLKFMLKLFSSGECVYRCGGSISRHEQQLYVFFVPDTLKNEKCFSYILTLSYNNPIIEVH